MMRASAWSTLWRRSIILHRLLDIEEHNFWLLILSQIINVLDLQLPCQTIRVSLVLPVIQNWWTWKQQFDFTFLHWQLTWRMLACWPNCYCPWMCTEIKWLELEATFLTCMFVHYKSVATKCTNCQWSHQSHFQGSGSTFYNFTVLTTDPKRLNLYTNHDRSIIIGIRLHVEKVC